MHDADDFGSSKKLAEIERAILGGGGTECAQMIRNDRLRDWVMHAPPGPSLPRAYRV